MLQANAPMRRIARRDSGDGYQEYLRRLARESGTRTPSREDLQRFDLKRKKTSSEEWTQPVDPSARVARMKDGRTRMAHEVEQSVDLEGGAPVAAVVQPADQGDAETPESATKELESGGRSRRGRARWWETRGVTLTRRGSVCGRRECAHMCRSRSGASGAGGGRRRSAGR